jgi:hypothetical protein
MEAPRSVACKAKGRIWTGTLLKTEPRSREGKKVNMALEWEEGKGNPGGGGLETDDGVVGRGL